jgi:putative ABC transport system permease protein
VLYLIWLRGLMRHRRGRLAGVVAGIAVSVALIATLAGFVADARAKMTRQAIADVAVDWQVQLAQGADAPQAIAELSRSPGYSKLSEVGYFDTPGFESRETETVQVTGPGKVLGLQPGYRDAFPAEIRDLVGSGDVLLAQQTAANLHAEPGSMISVKRPGLPPVEVTVDAVVDLPLADSLFQTVGAPAGSGPQAPPDNVLLMPLDQWHQLFDGVAASAPESLHTQLHVSLNHDLPSDPASAYTKVERLARNFEARLAGSAVVGDNLAARLDVARSDSLYAELLFLFLGLPGIVLGGLLTAVLVSSGAVRRRREQALLRLRGASTATILRLASLESGFVGIAGSVLGLALGSATTRLSFGRWGFGNSLVDTLVWAGLAAFVGLALAFLMVLVPAWREAAGASFVSSRATVKRVVRLPWERVGLDFVLLALAGLVFWLTARGGYQVVVAPEGVPRVSVSYTALLAPLFLWVGAALLTMRVTGLLLAGRGTVVRSMIRPVAGRLSSLVTASLSRQRVLVGTGLVLIALAVAFATSTAIFNSTYQAQSRVDAELTNGADVTVWGSGTVNLAEYLPNIQGLDGVSAAEPMQHRFAYVGSDLQDLYGIDPANLTRATRLSDAFFANGSARDTLAALASTSDGLLVSAETVQDFQLQPGDLIRLRLQNASDHQYHVVPFHYLGIVREFPTAPSDSFLVANSAYVAEQTGSSSVETLLIRAGKQPAVVAEEVRHLLGGTSGATVRDIEEQRRITNSSLTAVSLGGLTRIELLFAVALAAAGAGLVLALGLEERRRTLAIAAALGARPRQLGAFVWSEAVVMLAGGGAGGAALGWGVAQMLVKLLTGIFDPPPEHLSVPWLYLGLVGVTTICAIVAAGQLMTHLRERSVPEAIRRL